MSNIIEQSMVVKVEAKIIFDYFTVSEYIKQWLCADAIINPELDGAYELFWDKKDRGHNSTIGCKISSYCAPNYLSFDWKGPVQFEEFMNQADPLTHVTVIFIKVMGGTKVTLLHTGWRSSEEWTEAKDYFSHAWFGAFKILEDLIIKTYE